MIKIAIVVLLPLLVTNICYRPVGFITKRNRFRDIISKSIIIRNTVAIAVALASWLLSGLMFSEWTRNERLLFEYFFVILSQLIIDFIEKKEKERSILYSVVLSSLGIVSYSILTFGQIFINSDVATATLLAQAQVKYRQVFPASWCYVNGDIWLISPSLFTLPFSVLLYDQSLARMLGSLTLVAICSATIYITSKKFFNNDSWLISIPFFLLATFGVYEHILYQASYTQVMMFIVLSIWFCYEAIFEKKKVHIILYAVLIITLMIMGMRYIAEILVPMFAAVFVIEILENKELNTSKDSKLKEYAKKGAILILPVVIGLICHSRVCDSVIMDNTSNNDLLFTGSLEGCWNNLIAVFLSCFQIFGYAGGAEFGDILGVRNVLSLILCVLVAFAIPALQYKSFFKESKQVKFFCVFGAVHNLEMFVLGVFFDKISTIRYFLTSVFVFELLTAVYLYNHRKQWKNKAYRLVTFVMTLVVIIHGTALLEESDEWLVKLTDIKTTCREIVSYGLHKGYATYWNAYNNEVYSDLALSMASIGDQITENSSLNTEQWWLVDSNKYIPDNSNKTFLLLTSSENALVKDKIPNLFGNPSGYIEIKQKSQLEKSHREDKSDVPVAFYVYIWDYDIASKAVNGLVDNRLDVRELNENDYVSIKDGVASIKKYGNIETRYNYFDKGKYELTIKGADLSSARIEIESEVKKNNRNLKYDVIDMSEDTIVIELEAQRRIRGLWIRLYNDYDKEIKFSEMIINKK